MGRYLNERVVQLLRAYLKFCGACGFVGFTYNDEKRRFESTKWRRRAGCFFAAIYFPIALFIVCMLLYFPYGCKYFILNISISGVQFNLIFIILLQQIYSHGLLSLLNEFPVILSQVHKVTSREIVFSKMFGIRSVLQFIPMTIILFNVVITVPPAYILILIIIVKLLPDMLVEMLHHSVFIALYAVAKMYENLNEALIRKQKGKSAKLIRAHCQLGRFTEKLNKYLYGYFLLHFFMDCFMLFALVVTILLQCYSMRSMLFLAASTLNRMRTLMMVGDEISDRSRFFMKNGDHRIEFSMIEMDMRLCGAYAIDKKMFLGMIAKIFLFMIVTNQYLSHDPAGYNNYINVTHPLKQ